MLVGVLQIVFVFVFAMCIRFFSYHFMHGRSFSEIH